MLYVSPDVAPHFSKLKPGDALTGTLARPVYHGYNQIFPAGSKVQLAVDRIERLKKAPHADDRPFAIRLFAPRHQSTPVFRSATVTRPDGTKLPLAATFLKFTRKMEIRQGSASKKAAPAQPALILSADLAGAPPSGNAEPVTLEAGARARVILMQDLSASKSRRGDRFQAMLAEPLRQGTKVVLPAGSMFEGLITKRVPPRRLSRPGTLALSFTGLTFRGVVPAPISASLSAVEVDQGSHMKLDPEAAIHGGSPGVTRMLIETGVAAGLAKVTDDSLQLVLELLISTATDASTAGTARIAAACVSGIFMLSRHGRDVILPKYTQMEVTLNRTVSLR